MLENSANKWFQRATDLEAENAILREAIHKGDGMANEINILTKENREAKERIAFLENQISERAEALDRTKT